MGTSNERVNIQRGKAGSPTAMNIFGGRIIETKGDNKRPGYDAEQLLSRSFNDEIRNSRNSLAQELFLFMRIRRASFSMNFKALALISLVNGASHESSPDPLYFPPSLFLSPSLFFRSILGPSLVYRLSRNVVSHGTRATTLPQQIERTAVEKKARVAGSRYQLTICPTPPSPSLSAGTFGIKATMCEFVREIKPRKAQSCLVLSLLSFLAARASSPVNAGSKGEKGGARFVDFPWRDKKGKENPRNVDLTIRRNTINYKSDESSLFFHFPFSVRRIF